ncbi:MAG: DEAD/DEAH box helicase [Phycisphaerae bacterium]|nr:DEAD/DEAH box helicase [Phycisphaerae bacterium]
MILHGNWWDSRLHVWGQKRPATDTAVSAAAALRVAIGNLSTDVLLASVADEASVSLWLPCAPGRGGESPFRQVTVTTLAFSAADTIDLLANLPSPLPEACGDSLRYWAVLARYTLWLLAHQQFVPDVEEQADGQFAALWRPFAHDRDELAWLEHLSAIMPPVCCAVVTEDLDEDDTEADPIRLVEDFVGATLDAVIRRNVAEDIFFERIHERARKEQAPEIRWLSALLGERRIIQGSHEDNLLLADRVRTWVGRLEEGTFAEPLRLCFTLTEPQNNRETTGSSTADSPVGKPSWQVELHLQTQGDKGQRLEVAQVWSEPGGRPTLLGRHLGHRRDQLLAELSRAKQVFPLLEDLPEHAPPAMANLTTSQAHAFLREWAPLLQARGFGVTVPEWATQQERRLGMRLYARPDQTGDAPGSVTTGVLGLDCLMDFDWRVAIGNMQLSHAEFERLVAEGTPLVKYHDAWLEIDTDEARDALTFMRAQPACRMSLRDALRIACGAEGIKSGLPVLGLGGGEWIERLLRESPSATLESLPQPATFQGTLRPYQRRGLDWLVFLDRCGIGACLADDMGLGKTIQLIALLLHERHGGHDVGPTLLFAPASVVGNWEREIERFTGSAPDGSGGPLRTLVHHGPERLMGDSFVQAAPQHDVVLTTYALGYRDLDNLRRVKWHRIVLDEAQKIKNPQANQTMAIRSIPSTRRVALTGTPIENHLPELWSIMDTLNPGLLGSAAQFRKRFVVPIEKLGDREGQVQLRRLLQPFMLRRVKSDPSVICDLPEKMEMRVFCNLTPEQARLYQRIVDETLGVIDTTSGIRRRGLILGMLTRLKQACNHPCQLPGRSGPLNGRSGKCERLVEMLEEVLAEGDAALVFTQYREMGHLLEQLLTDRLRIELQFLHGGTPVKRRTQMVDRFQDPDGGIRVFLLSLKAGGLGLNLTAANHVFHFDRWWNPAVEAQATDRAHRVGQTRRVQVHKFVCIGTVEDRIDRMLETKRALAENIIGSGDDWLTGLSTQELRDYIMLSQEAVG